MIGPYPRGGVHVPPLIVIAVAITHVNISAMVEMPVHTGVGAIKGSNSLCASFIIELLVAVVMTTTHI